MQRVTTAAIDHTTTARRPRRRGAAAAVLVVVALVAAALAAVVAPAAPVAADGNEAVGAPLAARSITAGGNHTCAILPSGAVKCWGRGLSGRLGYDSTADLGDQPGEMAALGTVNLGAGRTATAVTAGPEHTCALLDNGTVKCWGLGNRGQLGQDSTTNLGDQAGEMAALPAVNLGAGRTATAITTGTTHTCALLDDATVKCWGQGTFGRLGQDSTANLGDQAGEMAALAAVNLGAGRTATAITAGNAHTCALLDNATVKCWGPGTSGQLGYDAPLILGDAPGEMAALAPVNLGAGRTATAITAGSSHTCALLDDATVKCWGAGVNGRLGQDSTTTLGDNTGEMAALAPVNLGAGRTATAITAGEGYTCALLDDATVKCWGLDDFGQLGQDSTANLGDQAGEMAALAAVNLGAGRTATAITTGNTHTCAVLDDATVKCWGDGTQGRLGQDSTDDLGNNPGEMAALPAINLGVPLQLRLTADESTYVQPGQVIHYHLTITNNSASTLTGVTIAYSNAPVCAQAVPDIAVGQVVTINCSYTAVGADYPSRANTATVDTDQTTPTASNTVTVPVGVPFTTATAVTAGAEHTCALLDDGTVKCWGAGFSGQLGQDSTATLGDAPGEMAALPAVNLGAGRTATAITAGNDHTCALLDNATVKCWGSGSSGQLGQDSTANLGDAAGEMAALPAVNLGAGRTATAVTAGNFHTCAVLDNATVKCWGRGSEGQLGQDSTTTLGDAAGEMAALPAINLGAGRTATAVTAGGFHTCALLDNATVKCWGSGSSGQLGQGSTTNLGDAAGEMAALPAVNLGAGRTATAVTAGSNHTCALLDNATVKCWGFNNGGQLGRDSNVSLLAPPADPINLGAGRTATAVTVGNSHTCALLDDATVKCWGFGSSGQLGQDSTDTLGDQAGEMATLAPVNLGAGRTATTIDAGSTHTCALLDNATVKCWGFGNGGRLGQDSTANLGDAPGEMAALPPIVFGLGPPASAPGLSVTKTADETTVVAGDTIHFHVTVANTGDVALNDVTVVDANAPDCDDTVASIAVGADHTVDCTYVTGAGDVGTYSNTASVTADEITTPVESNTVDVTVTITPGLGLTSGAITQTGSGTPIPGVVVAVLDTATFRPVAIATTNAAGQYFVEAPPGTYYVYAVDPTQDHTAGFHGGPTLVVVTEGNTTAIIDVALPSRRGTLAGTVSDTGGPIAGVLAMSVDLADGQPGAGDLTDNTGAYTIGGLTPGPRLLEFIDLTGGHTLEYYDNTPTVPGATILNIVGAATVTADAELAAATPPGTTAHLTGTITTTAGGGNLEGVAVFAVHAGDFSFAGGDLTDTNGTYDIALDPGDYKLAFWDPAGAHLFEWHDNQGPGGIATATTVTAVAGTPLATNTALTPTTGTVSGTVTQTGTNANLGNVFVAAINTNGVVVGGTTTAANGTYTLTGLPPGNIRIRFVDLNAVHTDEYHDNSPDFAGGTLVPITAGGATPNLNAALTPIGD